MKDIPCLFGDDRAMEAAEFDVYGSFCGLCPDLMFEEYFGCPHSGTDGCTVLDNRVVIGIHANRMVDMA